MVIFSRCTLPGTAVTFGSAVPPGWTRLTGKQSNLVALAHAAVAPYRKPSAAPRRLPVGFPLRRLVAPDVFCSVFWSRELGDVAGSTRRTGVPGLPAGTSSSQQLPGFFSWLCGAVVCVSLKRVRARARGYMLRPRRYQRRSLSHWCATTTEGNRFHQLLLPQTWPVPLRAH